MGRSLPRTSLPTRGRAERSERVVEGLHHVPEQDGVPDGASPPLAVEALDKMPETMGVADTSSCKSQQATAEENEKSYEEVILNYCFGHSQSTLVMCPVTNTVLVNHCSEKISRLPCGSGDKGPNAEYRSGIPKRRFDSSEILLFPSSNERLSVLAQILVTDVRIRFLSNP